MMNGEWASAQQLLFDHDFTSIANSSLFRGNMFRMRAIYLMKKACNFKDNEGVGVQIEYKYCKQAIENVMAAMETFGLYKFHSLIRTEPKCGPKANSPLCLEGIALSLLHMSYIQNKCLRMGAKRIWDEGKPAQKIHFDYECGEVLAMCQKVNNMIHDHVGMYACAKMLGDHKQRLGLNEEVQAIQLQEKDHLKMGIKRCSHTDFDENGPDEELVVNN